MESGTAVVSIISIDENKPELERNYSDETFYTDSSGGLHSKCKSAVNLLQKRRQLRPILGSSNPYRSTARLMSLNTPSKGGMSSFTEKIITAKVLRCKQLQNELTEAHFHLNELATENRLLKTLQKRQDMALKRYEGTQAELPKLISSHNEEVRTLKAKLKQVKFQWRDTDQRLKARENELNMLREQHRHLVKLSKDRHLGEREVLQRQVANLQDEAQERDQKLQMLTRKVMLEGKNYKHQLAVEVNRHKVTRQGLAEALDKVSRLQELVDAKEKYITSSMPRPYGNQSVSMVSFGTASRYRGLQSHINSEIKLKRQNHDHAVDEQEEDDKEEKGDDQHEENSEDQEYYEEQEEEEEVEEDQADSSSTYTEEQTNTSQQLSASASLENVKEVNERKSNAPATQASTLDFQTKRFQFSNRQGNLAQTVEESVSERTSFPTPEPGTSSRCSSNSKPKAGSRRGSIQTEAERLPKIVIKSTATSRRGSFQAEMERIPENVHKPGVSQKESPQRNAETLSEQLISAEKRASGTKRDSLISFGGNGKKGKEDLGLLTTLMNELQQERRGRKDSFHSDSNYDDYFPPVPVKDAFRRSSLNGSSKTVEIKELSSDCLKRGRLRRDSLKGEENKNITSREQKTTIEGRQALDDITRSWSELQQKIKAETDWANVMMDKYNSDLKGTNMNDGPSQNFNKKHLLAALNAIDQGEESVLLGEDGKEKPGIELFGGATTSVRDYGLGPVAGEKRENRGAPVPILDRVRNREQFEPGHFWEGDSGGLDISSKSKTALMQELFGKSSVVLEPLAIGRPDSHSDSLEEIPSARTRLHHPWNAN